MSQEFLGTGWAFPFQSVPIDPNANQIARSSGEDDVHQAILIILGTAPGERVMRPDFGCRIHDYLFAPNTTRTASLVELAVEEALIRWEPRALLEQVTAEPDPLDPALLRVSIAYTIRATDSRFNLVYPFYLERGAAS